MKRLLTGNLLTALLVILSSCGLSPTPPASTQNPPVYRGAQHVIVQQAYHVSSKTQTLTYQAQASPETIQAFYKTELGKDGWEYLDDLSSVTYLDFQWVARGYPNISAFGIQVVMTDTSAVTLVELKLVEDLPH